jgi:hypothetical protein
VKDAIRELHVLRSYEEQGEEELRLLENQSQTGEQHEDRSWRAFRPQDARHGDEHGRETAVCSTAAHRTESSTDGRAGAACADEWDGSTRAHAREGRSNTQGGTASGGVDVPDVERRLQPHGSHEM